MNDFTKLKTPSLITITKLNSHRLIIIEKLITHRDKDSEIIDFQ